MADDHQGGVTWISLQAEVLALQGDPRALSLLRDMRSLKDERVDNGINAIMETEGEGHGELEPNCSGNGGTDEAEGLHLGADHATDTP